MIPTAVSVRVATSRSKLVLKTHAAILGCQQRGRSLRRLDYSISSNYFSNFQTFRILLLYLKLLRHAMKIATCLHLFWTVGLLQRVLEYRQWLLRPTLRKTKDKGVYSHFPVEFTRDLWWKWDFHCQNGNLYPILTSTLFSPSEISSAYPDYVTALSAHYTRVIFLQTTLKRFKADDNLIHIIRPYSIRSNNCILMTFAKKKLLIF